MISIKFEGMQEVKAALAGMERQIPYALANGLNSTARYVKDAVTTNMHRVFDRPTPYTLKSLKMTPAKAPRTITASVWFKDPPNLSQKDHYLLPQIQGGSRPMKPFEMGLGGRYTVPGKSMAMDQYGNMGRGQLTKIMSQSGSFRESGYRMNKTGAGRNKIGDMFMLKSKRGKMPAGIYERTAGNETGGRIGRYMTARALGAKKSALNARYKAMYPRGIKPVMIFSSKAPSYSKRFDFYGIAKRVVDQVINREMTIAIEAEIKREFAYRARH